MRLGIDIGGTKIEAAALDADGTMRLRRRVPTPAGDYAGIIAAVTALVTGIESDLGPIDRLAQGKAIGVVGQPNGPAQRGGEVTVEGPADEAGGVGVLDQSRARGEHAGYADPDALGRTDVDFDARD